MFPNLRLVAYVINNAPPEFDVVKQLCILAFYKPQVHLLTKELCEILGPGLGKQIRVMTVDSIQGSECDFVILSLVRSSNRSKNLMSTIGFMSDQRRLNVALTRAKFMMLAVGNFATLQRYPSDLQKFVSDLKTRQCIYDSNDFAI